MPNLRGLTMLEARDRLAGLSIPFTFTGSGVVVEQKPAPYETIEPGRPAVIRFASGQTLFARLAESVTPPTAEHGGTGQTAAGAAKSPTPTPAAGPDAAQAEALVKLEKGRHTAVLGPALQADSASTAAAVQRRAKAVKVTPTPLPDLDERVQGTAPTGKATASAEGRTGAGRDKAGKKSSDSASAHAGRKLNSLYETGEGTKIVPSVDVQQATAE